MTRATWEQVEAWEARNGFTRLQFQCMWGEFVEERRETIAEEIAAPECRVIGKSHEKRACVELNG